jgi:hypothetical protein
MVIRFLLILFLSVVPSLAFAQAGSAGGNIGNDEKSLSGNREISAPVQPTEKKQKAETHSRVPGGFDGIWEFTDTSSCGKGGTNLHKIVGGRFESRRGGVGTISASGAYHFSRGGEKPDVATGQISGNHGSGSWHHLNDDCHGTWTAVRQ